MQLFCQSCQASFASLSHCPRCGSRLLAPQESFIHSSSNRKPPLEPILPTFTNRLIVGLLVAIGGLMGMRELYLATRLCLGHPLPEGWSESNLEFPSMALRLLAALVGGMLAGAGRQSGASVGAAVGFMLGLLLTGLDLYAAGRIQSLHELLGLPVLTILGTLGGVLGARLWPADAVLPEPVRASSHGSSLAALAMQETTRQTEKPTRWFAILPAAMLAMIGIMASDPIRLGIAKYSGGWINTAGVNRGPEIGLQIAAISLLLGGIMAGAGSASGAKHGFLAALLVCAGLLVGAGNRDNGLYPAAEGYLKLIQLEQAPLTNPRIAINVSLAIIGMMSAAGWLGSQLLPPLAPKHMRNPRLRQQV